MEYFIEQCEKWTFGKRRKDRIEASEMWTRKRKKTMKSIDRLSNQKFVKRIKENRTLLDIMRKGNRMDVWNNRIETRTRCRGKRRGKKRLKRR